MDYGFAHEGKVYTPNATQGITPAENLARNKAIETADLAEWNMRPSTMLAYFHFPAENDRGRAFGPPKYRGGFRPAKTGATVSTWLGKTIGTIMSARVYEHNFGSRMVALTVQGTNGATYHGRASWDWGQCVTLRKSARKAK